MDKKIVKIEWLSKRSTWLFKCTFSDGRYDYFVRSQIPAKYNKLVKKAILSSNKTANSNE